MSEYENNPMQRIPPNDADAEKAALSSMLLDKDALIASIDSLKKDDFYSPSHQALFEGMVELFIKNEPVELITIKNKLSEKGMFDAVGGIDFLTDIAMYSSTSANIRHYIRIIEQKSILRKLIRASNDIMAQSYEAKQDVSVILEKAEKSIFNIIQNRSSEEFSHINEILVGTIERIEKTYYNKEKITGLPTGFIDFDNKTAGLQKSDLILIASRPSMGKTAIALNIAQNVAVRHGIPTAMFSLEMSKEQLVNRLLSAEAMIDSQKMRTGALDQSDWMKIVQSVGPLSEAPIFIDDTPGISVAEMRAKCRRLKLEKGLGLIMIDYLQLMSGSASKNESRQQEISEISRSLKAIAREMEAPVIALSQLSRACEQRADHRPMLSDLRESGAIEQDADVVAFLYRDEYYNPDSEKKNQAEVIIAKQRNGPVGTVDLMYFGQYTKFANMMN